MTEQQELELLLACFTKEYIGKLYLIKLRENEDLRKEIGRLTEELRNAR